MLFNSYIFILLFLPLVLIGFYTLNRFRQYRAANLFLIGMSLWFYGYFNPWYLSIICGSIIANFAISKLMERKNLSKNGLRKAILAVGILANVAVIFYFKYYNFFLENVNALFGASFVLKNIVLPLGISFFTFQQISYLVDSYWGETKEYSLDEYALFVCFFPQLIAGPIVLHNEMIPQFKDPSRRRLIPENFAKGMYIFSMGLFKKVLIADTFGKASAWGFGTIDTLSSMEALLVSLSYTFQLYFDFSGYCDMAIGIGNLLNIDLPQNFNSPYKATSIMDFWNRWHMSLTRFLRTYIYFPLGGNRKGEVRTYLNVMAVYLISGIWHGANWTFVLWGALHGLLNCLNRIFKKQWEKVGRVTRWAATFFTVNLLWVIFRADSIGDAKQFFLQLLSMRSFEIKPELYQCFDLVELTWFENHIPLLNYLPSRIYGLHLWMFIVGAVLVVLNCKNSKEITFRPTIRKSLLTTLFMVWSIVSLASVSTFLYFNF